MQIEGHMNNEDFQRLLNASAPIILVGNTKRPAFKCLLLCGVLTMLCIMRIIFITSLNIKVPSIIVGPTIMCGMLTIFCLVKVWFPTLRSLTLNNDCFVLRYGARERKYNWKNVSVFTTKRVLPTKIFWVDVMMTVFDNGASDKLSEYSRSKKGFTTGIVAIYGPSAEQLAQLMNYRRDKALMQNN
jgi:hypothetical protein